ncbi:MAG: 4Fe-4S dicluster domain-containing protein [Candidatus Acetothermia bacterium]
MDLYRLSEENFLTLLDNVASGRDLFVPVESHGEISYTKWSELGDSPVHFPKNRLPTPPKVFFTPPKEEVAEFPEGEKGPERKKQAIFGIKTCDLNSLQVLDNVFLGEEVIDPYYAFRRHDTLLISSDCYEASDTCFCNKVESRPYPEEGFDLNVTKLPDLDDLLVEVNSDSLRGQEVYEENSDLFAPASEEMLERRRTFRESLEKELEKNNSDFEVPEDLSALPADDPLWGQFAEDCVECGACNLSCPTCHCFQLYEQREEGSVSRNKVWDSCNFEGFSRVAGGANPMESLESRVRNRFYDKFGRIPENHDIYGCTGCGRCIDGCMGEIDMRDVLKEVSIANAS